MATSAEGAARTAIASLCANGGFDVVLRLPGLAVSGSDAEQLGLGAPQFQDVVVGPAVWRKPGVKSELLVAAQEIDRLVGSQALPSAESLFQTAVGFVVSGILYAITDSEPLLVADAACAYRVSVRAPVWG